MMRTPALFACMVVAALFPRVATSSGGADVEASAARGAVAAPEKLAAEYGAQVMREGGNAIDAAVATALMLGVTDGHNSGIGGGCFIMIRTADGELVAIDGRETAPALASRDMFIRNGRADADLSQVGALASGVPGMLAACDLALREHGTKTLAELLRGAAETAEQGFALDEKYARRLAGEAETIRRFPETASVLLKEDGTPYAAGEVLRQPDLARTYRAIADNGIEWFYEGEFAQQVDAWMQENGGVLRAGDFAAYEAKRREPVVTSYRDYTVAGFPPPSSGGVHVGQILNILENFEIAEMDEAARRHVIAEAMKLAFADRAHWLGDPDFERVPSGLASQAYADELAARIRQDAASGVESHGTPPGADAEIFPQLPAGAAGQATREAQQDPATSPATTATTGAATPTTTARVAPAEAGESTDGAEMAARAPAPRERGILVGTYVRPIAPRTREIAPRTRVIEPRTRGIEPRTRVIAPRTRSIEPRAEVIAPRTSTIGPRTRIIAPRMDVIAPRTVMIEPRTRFIEPRQWEISPRQRRIEPRWVRPRYEETRLRPRRDPIGDSHTAHLSAADADGNFVAITSTVNTGFGSKVIVPGTGVILNNQMDDFAAQPGVPNFFGLVGAEANAVEAGKRPLSSMSPTIILRGEEPVLAIGAAGGPLIITATLQSIINHLDLGMPLEESLAQPRIHHQWAPDALMVETTLDPAVRDRLAAMGHTIDAERSGGFAVVQAVGRSADGAFTAAADPRGPGAAVVVEGEE